MSHKWLSLAMITLTVTAMAVAASTLVARADRGPTPVVIAEGTAETRREIQSEIQSDTESPTISFIDSPSATCYRASVGTCYIGWSYLYVSASSSQYIISMTVSINNHIRAYHSGFFQTSMYIPGAMLEPGFKVPCGWRGASGVPELGYSYNYVIRAAETGGLKAANYGTVTCPADKGTIFLPFVTRQ
jgi:hypothetical protein